MVRIRNRLRRMSSGKFLGLKADMVFKLVLHTLRVYPQKHKYMGPSVKMGNDMGIM